MQRFARSFERPNGARALLKTAYSPEGIASLERNRATLETLRSDSRLTDCGFQLPEILGVIRRSDAMLLLERVVPGEDGRITLQNPGRCGAALVAATKAIAILHRRSSESLTVSDRWLAEWIDGPAALLDNPICTLTTVRQRRTAIAAFRREQHAFWDGQFLRLGWGHGDFSPGNIMFTIGDAQGAAGAQETQVGGIIDWDAARPNAPAGFDACHLALTARRTVTGEELGQIVRGLLLKPCWSAEEDHWLQNSTECDGVPTGWPAATNAIRAMVGLVWLHQTAANLQKSSRYAASRLWTTANVERVLQVFLRDRSAGRS
jgi:hypothetical protein